MSPTVPIDLGLNLAFGSSVVLACRSAIPHVGFVRAPSLWALLAFEAMIFFPVGAYLLWRFPDWSYMYLAESGTLGVPDWTVAAMYPIAAMLGFGVTFVLIRKDKTGPAFAFCGGSLLLAAAVSGFGYRQLLGVGTTSAFRAGSDLTPIFASPLAWILGAIGVAVIASWAVTLWRLYLFGRAWQLSELDNVVSVSPSLIEEIDPTIPPRPRKAGG